jgi:lyso-ornithine lipid O-acyltransferase
VSLRKMLALENGPPEREPYKLSPNLDPSALLPPSVRASGRAASFMALTAAYVYANSALQKWRPQLALPSVKQHWVYHYTQRAVPLFGIDLHLVHGELPRDGKAQLIISNHRSGFDILVCIHLFGGVVLSHQGVADLPVVGQAAKVTDTIFVDRADTRSGAQAIRTMRARLKEGRSVIAYPEGTTFEGDEVRPFKRGAFTAAKGLAVDVLPIGLAYEPGCEYVDETFNRHLWRIASRVRTPVWIAIGDPMPVPTDEAGEEKVRVIVQDLVDRCARARDSR